MRRTFSSRELGFSRAEIVDDAPAWLRTNFFNQVLSSILSSSPGYLQTGTFQPLSARLLVEKLSAWMAGSVDPARLQGTQSVEVLRGLLLDADWFLFYDFIELVAHQLIEGAHSAKAAHASSGSLQIPPLGISFPWTNFHQKLNELFADSSIGWLLDESGLLQRTVPAEIAELERTLAESGFEYAAASRNIGKAKNLLSQRPCDAANVIKESVSAVESVARVLAPNTATLGDAVKQFRSREAYPALMLSVIEKLYAFASAEPGVRHGSAEQERVVRADTEFAYATSLAAIRYLKETRT